ncbi:MAG: hypothetical protein PHW63_02040 [Alphaproteobacteria bacterium]|nr:hypothetical protein [Alphaproteobacteria bacterium]
MTTVTDENLQGPLTVSTIMHVVALVVLYFGVPSLFKPPDALPWHPVPVDIVDIGEITNTRLKNTEETPPAKTAPPVKPAPAPEVKPPEPPKPAETKPEPKAAPEPDEAAIPKPATKPKPPEPPKKEEPKPQPQQSDPLASVLKNVAKMKPAPAPTADARPDTKKSEGETTTGASSNQGPALAERLTISQEDSLRRQIGGCWNMPIGARNAQDLIVEVLIEVNEDRTVRSAEVVDQLRYNTDSHFRAAAEAAMRALRHPKCTPLDLPPEQYEKWKTIRFNFDPRDML